MIPEKFPPLWKFLGNELKVQVIKSQFNERALLVIGIFLYHALNFLSGIWKYLIGERVEGSIFTLNQGENA